MNQYSTRLNPRMLFAIGIMGLAMSTAWITQYAILNGIATEGNSIIWGLSLHSTWILYIVKGAFAGIALAIYGLYPSESKTAKVLSVLISAAFVFDFVYDLLGTVGLI